MSTRRSVAVTVVFALSGCATTPATRARAPQAVADRNVQAVLRALRPRISPTAIEYVTDSIGVQDGTTVAVFPSSATVTHEAHGIVVRDPSSNQTFRFSAQAAVSTTIGGGRVWVEPGRPLPAWAVQAHARRVP